MFLFCPFFFSGNIKGCRNAPEGDPNRWFSWGPLSQNSNVFRFPKDGWGGGGDCLEIWSTHFTVEPGFLPLTEMWRMDCQVIRHDWRALFNSEVGPKQAQANSSEPPVYRFVFSWGFVLVGLSFETRPNTNTKSKNSRAFKSSTVRQKCLPGSGPQARWRFLAVGRWDAR